MQYLLLKVLIITLIALSYGFSEASPREETLNLVLNITSPTNPKSKDAACSIINLKIEELEKNNNKLLSSYLRSIKQRHCDEIVFENATEEENSSVDYWKSEPLCDQDDPKTTFCKYNHDTGKGLFILKEKYPSQPTNSIVCAQATSESNFDVKLLANGHYKIQGKCIVSSKDFNRNTPDVAGLFNWLSEDLRGKPVQMPKEMYSQCHRVFKNAKYCTPTLIVTQTEKKNIFEACSLTTKRYLNAFLFFRVSGGNSSWKCDLLDITKPEKEPRVLSVYERECTSDRWGNPNPNCALPYIPRSNKVRVNRKDFFF